MGKVLSQAGTSLADVYEVEGSIIGVEEIQSREVFLTHDMGSTISSERLIGFIERVDTGALAQATGFDVTLVAPIGIYRVMAIEVHADTTARTDRVQVSLRDPTTGREQPIFIWDTNNDVTSVIRMVDDGAAAANLFSLLQTRPQVMPVLGIGVGQRLRVGEEIVFRGSTTGFGAGDVTITALIYVATTVVAGVGSRGLPIPGW